MNFIFGEEKQNKLHSTCNEDHIEGPFVKVLRLSDFTRVLTFRHEHCTHGHNLPQNSGPFRE